MGLVLLESRWEPRCNCIWAVMKAWIHALRNDRFWGATVILRIETVIVCQAILESIGTPLLSKLKAALQRRSENLDP